MKRTDVQKSLKDLPEAWGNRIVGHLQSRLVELRIENDKASVDAETQRGKIAEVKEIIRWFGEEP